ncbi:hypothetical protein J2Z22_004719 [Paenibacillus forsythiae]|uniref:Uncharacterized protein n=1 Tax=Paenibacillus forsythiae TaxID=365616 RepID=A0ABU3HE67_9BACL|nr:hypothetical protein [Paenibacillus forsythiae]MDT3429119.1 hypothetical protein [Paenibacillus forsythiae]
MIIVFNHIKVEKHKSQYIQDEHYTIIIDGMALDVRLHDLYPNDHYLGLIPAMIDWLSFEEEKRLVHSRYRSTRNPEILPLLMCPDDCDLYCTLIVAEVITKDEEINWNKIGLDIDICGTCRSLGLQKGSGVPKRYLQDEPKKLKGM